MRSSIFPGTTASERSTAEVEANIGLIKQRMAPRFPKYTAEAITHFKRAMELSKESEDVHEKAKTQLERLLLQTTPR